MISAPIALAFTAGMVATFNPCGFSLLPAYIGAFVAGDDTADGTDRRVIRAIGVAAAVSVGFVLVFASMGLIINSLAGGVRELLPWVTIAIGGLLVIAGLASVAGWKPTISIRTPDLTSGRKGATAMVGYGATYATASLSCTIGPFLAVTGTALSQSPLEGLATYVAYALGMGVVILAISIASTVAHGTVTNRMRRLSKYAPRVGGVLMVFAGIYAIWYGRWELAVYDGDLSTDPLIDTMESVRLWIVARIEGIGGPGMLALVAVTAISIITMTSRSNRPIPTNDASETAARQ